jgi:hypothetical protein
MTAPLSDFVFAATLVGLAALTIVATFLALRAATLRRPIIADAEELTRLARRRDDTLVIRTANKTGWAASASAGLINRATSRVRAPFPGGIAALIPTRDPSKQITASPRVWVNTL